MKKSIFSFISFFAVTLSLSQAQASINDWDASIPLSSTAAMALITAKVEDLTYSDEGNYCGGQSSDYKLTDYYTTEDVDGALTFFLNVNYNATLTYDYCRTEVVRSCNTTIRISEDGQIKVGAVVCPEM